MSNSIRKWSNTKIGSSQSNQFVSSSSSSPKPSVLLCVCVWCAEGNPLLRNKKNSLPLRIPSFRSQYTFNGFNLYLWFILTQQCGSSHNPKYVCECLYMIKVKTLKKMTFSFFFPPFSENQMKNNLFQFICICVQIEKLPSVLLTGEGQNTHTKETKSTRNNKDKTTFEYL